MLEAVVGGSLGEAPRLATLRLAFGDVFRIALLSSKRTC